MDEIIYLESDEEITSVIDKIKNARSVSLGLVVPRNATLLQSVVNLRLILREAGILGKKIGIVTTDKIGRNLASQVGLPIYNSIKEDTPVFTPAPPTVRQDEIIEIDDTAKPEIKPQAPQGVSVHHFQEDRPVIRWRAKEKPVIQNQESEKESVRTLNRQIDRKTRKLIWPILVVILILISFVGYLLWPSAQVEIFVKAEDLNKSLPIVFTNAVTTPDAKQNIFPGVLIEASEQNVQKFPATGQKNSGGYATGTVTFYNGLDSLSHKYAAGTKIIASSKTYLLKTSLSVPGATVQNLKVVPGSATVEVEAETVGEDYNIKAGKFIIAGIPANQQAAIYAQSTSDFKGGFTKVVQVVSKDDYENAKNKVTEGLTAAIDQDLKTKSAGLALIEKAMVMPEPEVTSSSNIDQEATEFEMKVKLTKQVMAYDNTKFVNFLIQTLSSQVSQDKMVAIASKNDIGFVIDKQAYDKGELDTTVNVAAKIANKISSDTIKTGILGKSRKTAEQFVLNQPGVSDVTFDFKPAFWKNISNLSRNVKVNINYTAK